jgi:Fic family protein
MPEQFRVVTSDSGRKRKVIPGEFRDEEVEVGRHRPPRHDSINRFLQHFQQSCRLDRQHGDTKFIAAAASHQRLAWIHPFLDGNGRTARLFSHAYFSRIADGYRLWSISRGMALRRSDYMAMLAAADAPRRNDLDGRGSLSAEALANFCRFFFEVCIDQATFMDDLLRLDKLRPRIEDYAERRSRSLIPQQEPIRKEAVALLVEVGMRGHVARGEVQKITGLGERAARRMVSDLLKMNLLLSPSNKDALRLAFTSETTEYYLPSLYTG